MKTRSFLKYSVIIVGSLIVLIALAAASTQTSIFRDWLRAKVEAKAAGYINGQLTISRLEGNFFTNLQLGDILVRDQIDTVLFIRSIRVDLSPLRLLHYELAIDSISVSDPYIKLIQGADSSWNVVHLLREDTTTSEESPEKPDRSSFKTIVGDFVLRDGQIRVVALDSTMPSLVSGLETRFNAIYADTLAQIKLKEFGFRIDRPDFHLVRLLVDITRRDNRFTFSNLAIQTEKNQFGGGGTYVATDSAASSGSLASKPFDFSEFRSMMPGFMLHGSPVFEVETDLVDDSLTALLGIIDAPQRIDLRIDIATVSQLLNVATRDQVRYYLSGKLTGFELAHWLADSVVAVSTNGTFSLSGQGISPDSASVHFMADLSDLNVAGRNIGKAALTGQYEQGNAIAKIGAVGTFGRLNADVSVDQILTDQRFSATLSTEHLDLAPVAQSDSLKSDLNLRLDLNGSHLDPSLISGTVRMDLAKSTIFRALIDTMFLRASFDTGSYVLDTLRMSSPMAVLGASAQGLYSGSNRGKFGVALKDIAAIGKLLGMDSLGGSGSVTGSVAGRLDSLALSSELKFKDLMYGSYQVSGLEGSITAVRDTTNLKGSATLVARQLATAGTGIDSVTATADFDHDLSNMTVTGFYRKGIDAQIAARITLDTPLVIGIPSMTVNLNGASWVGGGPDTRIVKSGETYEIHKLALASPLGVTSGTQRIEVDGALSPTGAENIKLAVSALDLKSLATSLELPATIGGLLSVDAHLTGTASNPVIVGKAAIESGSVNQYRYQALHAGLKYEAEKLTWSSSLLPYQADSLGLMGVLPVELTLTGDPPKIHRDQPMELTVRTDGLPLDIITASGAEVKQASGFFTADVTVTGTLNAPVANGNLGLRDGSVSLPKFGIDYRDIQAGFTVTNQQIVLDTLQVRRDQGMLTGSGTIQFQDNLMSGTIKTTQFDFLADKFFAVRHKDFRIQISGDAYVKGDPTEQTFGGSITVMNSMFFLPAVLEQAAAQQAAADKSIPLLVAATAPQDTTSDSTRLTIAGHNELDTTGVDWYKNLRGEFKLAIPKNTWLRSPDMNLEIGEGDIDLIKNGPSFEIFGPIKILRGQYNLYGKRFTILQGNLLFTGGAEYNPDITMEAQYVFRTADREKRTLKVDISGKAFSPVLKFTIDDNVIEERDAIAYVMYGRSMDELTSGQKSQTGSAQGELAKGAAANMLAGQLSQALGSKLGLDVVDISSQGSLSSATLTVGKYLTGNLFMSYSRGIGQSQDQEPVPQIVTLEYELSKYLFLQLLQGDEKSSGADLIFKFQR
jgi:translocation and assembly module TamB